MKRHLVLVLTEPTEGNEAAFNDYYEHTHLGEVLATTGWRSAQRYRVAGEAGEACPLPYLAVYEADAENAGDILDTLNSTRADRQQSDTLNRRTGRVWVFEPIGDRIGARIGDRIGAPTGDRHGDPHRDPHSGD